MSSGTSQCCASNVQTQLRELQSHNNAELRCQLVHALTALAQRIPWTEEPGGLQPMGLRRVGHD